MRVRPLNGPQRAVLVVALGSALYLFGQWLLETWEFGGRRNFGWVAYAPLSNSINVGQLRILHPWVVLLFWLVLLGLWTLGSLAIFHRRSETSQAR